MWSCIVLAVVASSCLRPCVRLKIRRSDHMKEEHRNFDAKFKNQRAAIARSMARQLVVAKLSGSGGFPAAGSSDAGQQEPGQTTASESSAPATVITDGQQEQATAPEVSAPAPLATGWVRRLQPEPELDWDHHPLPPIGVLPIPDIPIPAALAEQIAQTFGGAGGTFLGVVPMSDEDVEKALGELATEILTVTADICPTCLELMEEGHTVKVFPCKHMMHEACTKALLEKLHKNCPTCRALLINQESSSGSTS